MPNNQNAVKTNPELKIGDVAPDFTLFTQKGDKVNLYELCEAGKKVLLVFYPQDMTPGCTTQLCGIRDVYDEYKDLDVAVYGVNQDTPHMHSKFIDTYVLPFDLLIDEGRAVAQQFGAVKSIFGNVGTKRGVFLIGSDKKIIYQVWGQQNNEDIIQFLKDQK